MKTRYRHQFLAIMLIIFSRTWIAAQENGDLLLEEEPAMEINGHKISRAEFEKHLKIMFGKIKLTEMHRRMGVYDFVQHKVLQQLAAVKKVQITQEELQRELSILTNMSLERYFYGKLLKSPYSFCKLIEQLLPQDAFLWKRHKQTVANLELAFQAFNQQETRQALKIWHDLHQNIILHHKLVQQMLKGYSTLEYLKMKAREQAICRKLFYAMITPQYVEQFYQKEKRGISGVRIDASCIYLSTINMRTKRPYPSERQALLRQKVLQIKAQLKPDNSNFEQLARRYNSYPPLRESGGHMGLLGRWDFLPSPIPQYIPLWPAVVFNALFQLQDGQVSDVLEVSRGPRAGYYLIKANFSIAPQKALSEKEQKRKAKEMFFIMISYLRKLRWQKDAMKRIKLLNWQ